MGLEWEIPLPAMGNNDDQSPNRTSLQQGGKPRTLKSSPWYSAMFSQQQDTQYDAILFLSQHLVTSRTKMPSENFLDRWRLVTCTCCSLPFQPAASVLYGDFGFAGRHLEWSRRSVRSVFAGNHRVTLMLSIQYLVTNLS